MGFDGWGQLSAVFDPAIPGWMVLVIGGVTGLLLGSFLNVVAVRLPPRMYWSWRQEARACLAQPEASLTDDPKPPGWVIEPSRCPRCHHRLSWWENLPLLSFLLLAGRCRKCRTTIAWRYPLMELLGAAIPVVAMYLAGWTPLAAAWIVVGWLLLVAAAIDVKEMLLPDGLTFGVLWLGLLASVTPFSRLDPDQAIVGAAVGYGVLWAINATYRVIRQRDGMGQGDWKLLAALGAWLGASAILPILAAAAIAGAMTAIVMGLRRQQPLPFGPFLALAGWLIGVGVLAGLPLPWLV